MPDLTQRVLWGGELSCQVPTCCVYIRSAAMINPNAKSAETQALFARLCAFCFPGGEEAARRVRSVNLREHGGMCMSPGARWIPFTAEEVIDCTQSSFRWTARLDSGKITSPTVTDAYEAGHGQIVVKVGGILSIQKVSGADADKGEIQRYLSSIALCPAILLNHSSLECTAVNDSTLRVRDRDDPTGSTVEIEISERGEPLACRADRPRLVGRRTIVTPWSGMCSEFCEWRGLRVASRLEVQWHLPEGPFTCYRSEITSWK